MQAALRFPLVPYAVESAGADEKTVSLLHGIYLPIDPCDRSPCFHYPHLQFVMPMPRNRCFCQIVVITCQREKRCPMFFQLSPFLIGNDSALSQMHRILIPIFDGFVLFIGCLFSNKRNFLMI